MSRKAHLATAALGIAAALALGAVNQLGGASALAADTEHLALQLKPGLWEFNHTAKISGDPVVPSSVLNRVPAAERAQFLADMRMRMVQPQRIHECVTPTTFERQLFTKSPDCTQTVISNTASGIEIQTKCERKREAVQQYTDHKIVASGATDATGSIHAVVTSGSKTMTVDATDIGKWLASDCGALRDDEIRLMQ